MLSFTLAALLNLSVLRANQPKLAKRGLMSLLSTNSTLQERISAMASASQAASQQLVVLASEPPQLLQFHAPHTMLHWLQPCLLDHHVHAPTLRLAARRPCI